MSDLPARGEPLGFPARTLRNLQVLEAAYGRGEDVHLVTAVATATLGLVAFPKNLRLSTELDAMSLEDLVGLGWPRWSEHLGSTNDLRSLVRHLRNAIAHSRIEFSSESRILGDVTITFADRPKADAPDNWCVSITAEGLQTFCRQYAALLGAKGA